jgi:hypothetical protein
MLRAETPLAETPFIGSGPANAEEVIFNEANTRRPNIIRVM